MAHDHKKNDLNTFTAACPLLQPVSAEFFLPLALSAQLRQEAAVLKIVEQR